MSPRRRRIVQAVLYETFAVLFVGPVLGWVFGQAMVSTLGLALVMSVAALGWSYVFNQLFERWESRQPRAGSAGRSLGRRLAHGLGFEGGLVVLLVPLMAWWLQTSLINALIADLGFLVFFFVYAVGFTWAFDRVFGLPVSAQGGEDRPPQRRREETLP